jgi:hypothetical protein
MFDRAPPQSYRRLLARADLDGIVAAALLRACGATQEVGFLSEQALRCGPIPLDAGTITVGLPELEGASLAFAADADGSAARAIHGHFGGRMAFPAVAPNLLDAADRAAAAGYTAAEMLAPTGWTLLDFVLDPRSRLAAHREFRICDGALHHRMIELVRLQDAEAILCDRHLSERVRLLLEHEPYWHAQLQRCARTLGDTVVVDLRAEPRLFAGHPFVVDALHPHARRVLLVRRCASGLDRLQLRANVLARGAATNPEAVVLGHTEAFPSGGAVTGPSERIDALLDALIPGPALV